MEKNTFKPYKDSDLELPISTLDDPVWYFDGDELGLVILGKSPGWQGEGDPVIWISIEERNHYCDRGHFLVKIITGDHALCVDAADFRPCYYMHLEIAKSETIEWLKWRIRKERAEPYGKIRERTNTQGQWAPIVTQSNDRHEESAQEYEQQG